ncbi:MAG: O-antigen ligase family protein, partial [Micropepsaceae bacterium]
IVGTATVLAIHRQYAVLLAGGFAVLLLAAVFAQSIETYLIRGDQLENIQTMSGRSVMWQAAWQAFLDRPVSGYGFGVGGRSLFLGPLAGFGAPISSLHSGFMELLVGVGLLGFVPWVMALVWTIRNAIVSGLRRARTQEAAIVLPLLVMTVMSTGAGGWFDTSVAYYLCCAAILGQPLARSLSAPIRATSQARRGS